jgi:hypothetical protein
VAGRNDSLACSGDMVAAVDARDVAADTDTGAGGAAAVEYRVTAGAVEDTGDEEAAVVEDTGAASAVVAHTAWAASEMDIVVAVLEEDSTAAMAAAGAHSAEPLVVVAWVAQRPFA